MGMTLRTPSAESLRHVGEHRLDVHAAGCWRPADRLSLPRLRLPPPRREPPTELRADVRRLEGQDRQAARAGSDGGLVHPLSEMTARRLGRQRELTDRRYG